MFGIIINLTLWLKINKKRFAMIKNFYPNKKTVFRHKMSDFWYIDIYSQREDGHALELTFPKETGFIKMEKIALNRLVIEWKSSFADENIFGIVDTNLIKWEYQGKQIRPHLYTFAKAKNTTMTDIHVPNPAFHHITEQLVAAYNVDCRLVSATK